jgi:hypothetical protein
MKNKNETIHSPNSNSQDTNSVSVDKASEDTFEEISLFKNPFQTLFTLISIIIEQINSLFLFLRRNYLIPLFFLVYFILVVIKDGPHREVFYLIELVYR